MIQVPTSDVVRDWRGFRAFRLVMKSFVTRSGETGFGAIGPDGATRAPWPRDEQDCIYRIMIFRNDVELVCFGHRTRMAARAVTRAYNSHLRPVNLQITQLSLLVAIERDDTRSMAVLADRLDLEASAVLRNLKILERRGLVANDGGRGRRGRRFSLTVHGKAMLAAAAPLWEQAQSELTRGLNGRAKKTRAALVNLETAALRMEGSRT
jgi:DNA-binding MarR family transcriptional regulator